MRLMVTLLLLFMVSTVHANGKVPFNHTKTVIAASSHSIVLGDDGLMWVWGYTEGYTTKYPELASELPLQVFSDLNQGILLSDVDKVLLASDFTIVIQQDGTSYILGRTLGFHVLPSREALIPRAKIGNMPLKDIASISYRYEHNIALMKDGTVWEWDSNHTSYENIKPEKVIIDLSNRSELVNIDKVIAHSQGGMALRNDGTVWGWGGLAEISSGVHIVSDIAVPILADSISKLPLNEVTDISRSPTNGFYAIKDDGSVWGYKRRLVFDSYGYIENLQKNNSSNKCPKSPNKKPRIFIPEQIFINQESKLPLSDVMIISNHDRDTVIVRGDGTVWHWTYNYNDDKNLQGFSPPVQIMENLKPLTDVVDISVGYSHGLALKKDGTVWSWGSNKLGELGIGYDAVEKSEKAQQVFKIMPLD